MKKQVFLATAIAMFGFANAQDIPQSQVPSVILSSFNTNFPKAQDIEWEMEGTQYKVDFETGWSVDHEVWYSANGEMVKHKEDISPRELPESVNKTINTKYVNYSIDSPQRITEGQHVYYKVDFDSLLNQDWEVVMDANGNELSKMAD